MRTRFRKPGRRCPSWLGVVLLGLCFGLAGCAQYEPFEPAQSGEIPEGPGLFTGEKGEVILFSHGKVLPKKEGG